MAPKQPDGGTPPADPEPSEGTWDPGASMSSDGRIEGTLPTPAASAPAAVAPRPPPVAGALPTLAEVSRLELGREVRSIAPDAEVGGGGGGSLLRPVALVALLAAIIVGVGFGAHPLERLLASRTMPTAGQIPLVSIESDPTGAEIFSGAESLGTTPLMMPNDYPASTTLTFRLEKRGYESTSVSFVGALTPVART